MRLLTTAGIAIVAFLLGTAVRPSSAQEPASGITVVCPATGPGVAVCAGIGVLLHELVQSLNGKEGFGENGEAMKLLKAPISIVSGNVEASSRERGDIAKTIRVTTGVSIKDIQDKGLLGGENSEARKICNGIAGIVGGKC
jgi:hypothetical protein